MGWRYWRRGTRVGACSAFFGIGAIAGLLPGLRADPVAVRSSSPAEIVAARFEANSIAVESEGVSAPSRYVLASAVEGDPQAFGVVFTNPDPVYQGAPPQAEAAAPRADTANADPDPARKTAAPAAADTPRRPAPAPHPAAPSTVLNPAQIVSIRERLKLNSYQTQLWPPVESALREISWRKDAKGKIAKNDARSPAIDPESAQVQRLKSAAVPLIMSFNDDQKQEVRTMLRLMGLESLATQF
jgi:hypothetical protein